MSSEYNLNDDFAKADPTLPSSMKDNGPFDPIRDAVNEKSTDFITKGLDTFQKTSFSTEISTTNATEAILNYLDDNYNSFSANEDFSYTSMNLKDTKHFVQNIDKAYGEISHSCSDVQSLNFTLAKFLTGNQLSVLPTKGMLRYYNIKNFVTNGLDYSQLKVFQTLEWQKHFQSVHEVPIY